MNLVNMNKPFYVDNLCNCDIHITDTSYSLYKDQFNYKDTVTIDIITYNNLSNPQRIAMVTTDHNRGYLNECKIPLSNDGHYTIHHIILPTVDWYYKQIDSNDDHTKKYFEIIVSDCKNVYKVEDGKLYPIDVEYLINKPTKFVSMLRFQQEYVMICHINNCFNKSFTNLLDDPSDQNKYKTDFIWCTLEVLKILICNKEYEKAENIIENFFVCGGFCNQALPSELQQININTDNSTGYYLKGDCGCH